MRGDNYKAHQEFTATFCACLDGKFRVYVKNYSEDTVAKLESDTLVDALDALTNWVDYSILTVPDEI